MISKIDKYIESKDALFHYTRLEIGLEEILANKKFRLSIYNKTNDPREYKFIIFNSGGSISKEDEKKLWQEAHPILDNILKYKYKVMCVCSNMKNKIIMANSYENNTDVVYTKAWKKSRMWSQYGENHRGLCLVFSKKSIDEQLTQMGYNTNNSKSGLVSYTSSERFEYRAITLNIKRLHNEGTEKYCQNHILNNLDCFFFTKNIDYRDESEFRYVFLDPDNKYIYFDIEPILKYVIIGDNTPKVYYPMIDQLCSNLNIKCRRVEWSKGEPYLLNCSH